MFIYLIFILNLIKIVSLSESEIKYLNENQIISVENPKQVYGLEIFCISGQHKSLTNALMSSYIHFLNGSKRVDVFSHHNYTQIYEYFNRRRLSEWPIVSKWLHKSNVTNIIIPTFYFYCIGIASNDSYELELKIQTIDLFRLATLLIGLLLYNFGGHISRSGLFYYTCCATIGTFASFLIIFFIIGRYFPRKVSGLLIMLGSSAVVCAFKIFWESLLNFMADHFLHVLIYSVLSALISMSLGYRFGPITNPKTLNLMQWFLQSIGLILIAISSQIFEYSCIAILTAVLWKMISFKPLFSFKIERKKETKISLLTESEYEQQSDRNTKKALEELKAYCLSSECNAWNMINKLKDPIKFARFINGENHISDNEIMVYENSESSHSLLRLLEDINSNCNQFNDILINQNNNETIDDVSDQEFKDSFDSLQSS